MTAYELTVRFTTANPLSEDQVGWLALVQGSNDVLTSAGVKHPITFAIPELFEVSP